MASPITWFWYTVFPVTMLQLPEHTGLPWTSIGYQVAGPKEGWLPIAGTNAMGEAWAELTATRLNLHDTFVIPLTPLLD